VCVAASHCKNRLLEVIVIMMDTDEPGHSARLTTQYSFLRLVRHRRSGGIADALRTGYLHARGGVLVFYPLICSSS